MWPPGLPVDAGGDREALPCPCLAQQAPPARSQARKAPGRAAGWGPVGAASLRETACSPDGAARGRGGKPSAS